MTYNTGDKCSNNKGSQYYRVFLQVAVIEDEDHHNNENQISYYQGGPGHIN
jgi:hypothetical protein